MYRVMSISVLLIFMCPFVSLSADWILVAQTKDGSRTTYYDRQSVTAAPDNSVRLWTKTVYSEEGRKSFIKRLKERNPEIKGYENLSYALYYEEINCTTREQALLEVGDYSSDGKAIYQQKMNNKRWIRVLTGSMADNLLQKICPGSEKKQ